MLNLSKCVSLAALATTLSGLAQAFTSAPSSGCGKRARIPGGTDGHSPDFTITSSGISRNYLLHLPASYSNTFPHALIFSFHGHSHTAVYQEKLTGFSDPFFNEHYIVVYPQGVDNEWQSFPGAKTNDVQFTLDLISRLESDYCIDSNRIYASGKSNGGGFSTNVLACDSRASKKIAAFASCSGAYYEAGISKSACEPETIAISCSPSRKNIPILAFHGTEDTVIPWAGGWNAGGASLYECLPTVGHFLTLWGARDGLTSSYVTLSGYGGNVKKYLWGEAAGKEGLVTGYKIGGLGHVWSSTIGNADGPATYFNATSKIMDFFGQHTLDGTAYPAT